MVPCDSEENQPGSGLRLTRLMVFNSRMLPMRKETKPATIPLFPSESQGVIGGSVGDGGSTGGSVGGGSTGGSVGGGGSVGCGGAVGGTRVLAGGFGVSLSLGRLVTVGQIKVRDGVLVGVVDSVDVGEGVDVKVAVDAGVRVSVAVRELVAVTASVVKASIGSTLAVLLVAVANSPPVFGMMISGSCSSRVTELETINGRLNAIKRVTTMTANKIYSFVFNSFLP